MKTLDEYNEERRKAYESEFQAMQPHANGIACLKCGNELWDSNPCLRLTSNPPKKNIHCPSCGYTGFRLA